MGNIPQTLKNHKNVVIIIAAGLLIELFSAAQYYYAHNLLEEELDHRAENELRVKALMIRGILKTMEKTVSEHIWDIKRNIAYPDSMFDATARIIENTPEAIGSCLVFAPNFYPQKGRLFEPYAYKEGNNVKVKQISQEGVHDYTTHPAYQEVRRSMKPFWSDPYQYETDSTTLSLTTYSYPLTDNDNRFIAICGLDLSLEQIGDTLNARPIYPSSFNLLLTSGGKIISGPSKGHPKTHDVQQVIRMINDSTVERTFSRSGHSKCINFVSETDNAHGCIYYANMRRSARWQVAVVCYDDEVYEDLLWMRIKIFFLMLLGFGVLDLPTGRFRYCNAGHDVPYLIANTASEPVPLPVISNIPIGLFPEFEFKMQQTIIEKDTTIFLYTDGLTEAKNPAHKQFGIERIEKTLTGHSDDSPEQMIERMNQQVHAFMEQEEQSDDLTMLSIRYMPKRNEYDHEEEFMLTNDIKHVDDLNKFVDTITTHLNFDKSKAANIKLAVEEAVVNVIEYAYPQGTKGDISVQAMYNKRKLKFVITDSGVAFNPTKSELADTTLSAEDRPIGGLGILLVRELMDSINYERIDNKNTLTLITHYEAKE